jgi:crotonobetainyl-CoA:carnitine CoA-transferase CaiB-like acyl-CoA transferase
MTGIEDGAAALAGLKVVECATVVAAPLCGRMLADFGAEVIHVEPPGKGDHLRNFGFEVDGINPWWKYYSRNKKLITLDISKPKGRAILLELLRNADIFIENFRTGRLDEWGIRFEDLQEINPRLIVTRVTGFGQTGPYALW